MRMQKIGGASHTHDVKNAATDKCFPLHHSSTRSCLSSLWRMRKQCAPGSPSSESLGTRLVTTLMYDDIHSDHQLRKWVWCPWKYQYWSACWSYSHCTLIPAGFFSWRAMGAFTVKHKKWNGQFLALAEGLIWYVSQYFQSTFCFPALQKKEYTKPLLPNAILDCFYDTVFCFVRKRGTLCSWQEKSHSIHP